MNRIVSLLLALTLISPPVHGAPADEMNIQQRSLTAWELGLYPIGETLGKQIKELVTMVQYGSSFQEYKVEGREWNMRTDFLPFLLYQSLQMRPAVRVLNYAGDPEIFSEPENHFFEGEWNQIQSGLTLDERLARLATIPSFGALRSWQQRGVELSLHAMSQFTQFSNEGFLYSKLADVPCEEICLKTMEYVQSTLPSKGLYLVEIIKNRVLIWLRLPKSDADIGGYSQPVGYTPPQLNQYGPAIYEKASNLLSKSWRGKQIASGLGWVGDKADRYLSDEEFRSMMTLIAAPTGRALQQQLFKVQRLRTMRKYLDKRFMAVPWIRVRQEIRKIEKSYQKLPELVQKARGSPKALNFLRKYWPFSGEPGVSRQASRVMWSYKPRKFTKVANLSGRILSIVGKSLLVITVTADAASALLAMGETRDVVIKKVARIFSDAGLGAGALYMAAAVPLAGLILAGVAVAGELGNTYVHPDIPTTEDTVEGLTAVLADGYKLSSNVFWQGLRGRNLIAEEWEKLRDKPLQYRLQSSDEIRESPLRLVDLSNTAVDSKDGDSKTTHYRRHRRIYGARPDEFRRALRELGENESVRDRILQLYAKRYLETLFSALMYLGDVAPNRAIGAMVTEVLSGSAPFVAPYFIGRELSYQFSIRDSVLSGLSKEIEEYLAAARTLPGSTGPTAPTEELKDPRRLLYQALEYIRDAWMNCLDYDESGLVKPRAICTLQAEEKVALKEIEKLKRLLSSDMEANPISSLTSHL